jgi:hypothetical protein
VVADPVLHRASAPAEALAVRRQEQPGQLLLGQLRPERNALLGQAGAAAGRAPRYLQLAEDQENFACGFWPGNATLSGFVYGEPAFYAYIYPEPAAFKTAAVTPLGAYDARLGQFVLPYDAARLAPDPDEAVLGFLTSAYAAAADAAGWDRAALEQPAPAFGPRRSLG